MTDVQAAPDRRARRRNETIVEILDLAEAVMSEKGVNGLTLAEVARNLGVKPPSLYKYFDSLNDLYDALFRRGQVANLETMQAAVEGVEPGLPTLYAALDASGRWSAANPALTQLMFWRPVPNFVPSAVAMEPSIAMVQLQRQALSDAVSAGQLGADADSDEALFLVSVFVSGVIGQSIANEPGQPWGTGPFSSLFPQLLTILESRYPPVKRRRRT